MPVEVNIQCYGFRPLEASPSPNTRDSDTIFDIVFGEGKAERIPSSPSADTDEEVKRAEFRYNPLHDFESLWWVAIHFIVKREVVDSAEVDPAMGLRTVSDEQRIWAAELSYDPACRLSMMVTEGMLADRISVLHPSIQPIARRLEGLRTRLTAAYRRAEADLSSLDYTTCADDVYKWFRQRFLEIARSPSYSNVNLRPFSTSAETTKHTDHSSRQNTSSSANSMTSGSKRSERMDDLPVEQSHRSKKARTTPEDVAKPAARIRPYLPRKVKVAR